MGLRPDQRNITATVSVETQERIAARANAAGINIGAYAAYVLTREVEDGMPREPEVSKAVDDRGSYRTTIPQAVRRMMGIRGSRWIQWSVVGQSAVVRPVR